MDLTTLIAAANRALQNKYWDDAIRHLRLAVAALQDSGRDASVLYSPLGQALANVAASEWRAHRFEAGREAALEALALLPTHSPAVRLAQFNLAACLTELRQYPKAIEIYHALLTQSPADRDVQLLLHQARLNYSIELEADNRYPEALELSTQLEGVAQVLRKLIVPWIPHSITDLHTSRAAFAQITEHLPNTAASELAELAHNHFALAYQAQDDLPITARLGDWLVARAEKFQPNIGNPSSPSPKPGPKPRSKPRSKRIGLVSSFWRECTIGSYFSSWLIYLRDSGLEVELYQLGPQQDHQTDRLISLASRGAVLNGSLSSIAEQLAARELDLLIYPELGMDGRTLALACLRLARTQWCAWGHPVSTGLPSLDGFLSCAEMEPPDGPQHYREPLLLLPGLGTRYQLPERPEAKTRSALDLPEGTCIFLPQSPFKINPHNDAVMLELALALPQAHWILFESSRPAHHQALQARLRPQWIAAGLNPQHLKWLPMQPRARFLQIAASCDFAFDTQGFSGGNTTLDCLAMALPVLTHQGQFMRGRQSAAMLRALGCEELIYPSTSQLVWIAQQLLGDPAFKASLQQRMRAQLPSYAAGSAAMQRLLELVRTNLNC